MNNRQNNNRRRGRNNNNRNNNNRGGGGVDHQNRIDNRARGNASQMLDKYKKLAQDAQLNDDRVNAEYYLQFADHYFRVLADYRARQEAKQEERRARDEERGHDGARDDNRRDNNDRDEKPKAADSDDDGDEKPQREKSTRKERAPRAPRRSRDDAKAADKAGEKDGIDLAVLPPAISADDGPAAEEKPQAKKVARKPRARKPKPAGDSGDEVATAAE